MPFVELSKARLFYQQMGSGPPMVMIHGLAANHAFWFNRIAFALKQRFRLTLPDLRGHGRSSLPPTGYTTRDMAEDLAELMNALAIPRAILVGHSFGGNVALHLATLQPHRVDALVLADTRVYALQAAQRLGDSPSSSLEEELLQGAAIDGENEQHIGLRLLEEWVTQRRRDAPPLPGVGGVPFGRDGVDSRSAGHWLRLISSTTAREDFRSPAGLTRERIRALAVPLLAVYGERSRCLPSGMALQQLVDDCTLRVVPEAGHFHPLTRPQALLWALAAFLRRLERGDVAELEEILGGEPVAWSPVLEKVLPS